MFLHSSGSHQSDKGVDFKCLAQSRWLAPLFAALVLSACGPGGIKAPVEDKTQVPQVIGHTATEDLTEGLPPATAIALLLETANNRSVTEALALRIQAMEISIANESQQQISQRMHIFEAQYPRLVTQLEILRQRILLSQNKAPEVLENISQLERNANQQEKQQLLALKADALEQAGFPIESVQIRIELDQTYGSAQTDKQQSNDQALWHSLMQVSADLISSHISEIPDTLSGWLELAYLSKKHKYDSDRLNSALDDWIVRNNQHPANRNIIEQVRRRQIATSQHPQHIALALPLTGRLASVGQAVRDGFMSSYFETAELFGIQIKIDIYDTEGEADIAALAIQQANQAGVEFIIGPLDKKAVMQAVEVTQQQEPEIQTTPETQTAKTAQATQTTPAAPASKAPLLVLNQITNQTLSDPDSTETSTPIYQFTLAPESEARQAAERASMDGHQYAMVMVPENIWGNRLYEAFATRYLELGGTIIAEHRFKKGTVDYSKGIQHGVNLDLSKLRHRQIKQLLNKDIEFTPRPRKDMDMIFIAASPQEARQIKPQLRFFYAEHVPVYATSHIFAGKANTQRDKDLEGIRFADMPWVLDDKPAPGSLARIINNAWPKQSARHARFYALGADAFRLLPQLEWLSSHPSDWMNGDTGRLSMTSDKQIDRQLSWAIFRQGIPSTQLTTAITSP